MLSCQLHFWQNDQDLLRTTAVTWGWNGYQNVSWHRRPWRRKLSCHFCGKSNPGPLDHESGALTTDLSLFPSVLLSVFECKPVCFGSIPFSTTTASHASSTNRRSRGLHSVNAYRHGLYMLAGVVQSRHAFVWGTVSTWGR